MNGVGVGGEEQVLDPAGVAVAADVLVAVAEGVRGAGPELVGEREREELESFGFQIGDELEGNAVVGDLEEAYLLAGLDELRSGVGVGKVDGREIQCRRTVLSLGELFHCWFGEEHHGERESRERERG